MFVLGQILVGLVALAHVLFLVLEMFLWTKPAGLRIFRNTREFAAQSATLAANQGLYNGFLSAGLIWSLLSASPEMAYQLKIFFLTCVIVAGAYGGYSFSRRILYVQALPAALALSVAVLAGI